MGDLDDYRIDSAEGDAAGDSTGGAEPPAPRERSSSPPLIAGLAVVAALALVAVLYFWFFGRQPAPPEIQPPEETAPTAPRPPAELESEPIEEQALPPLDASDEMVRRVVGTLSENPQLAAWLVSEDLARRFVVAIDNVAEGVAPRSHLGMLEPSGEFEVETRGERQFVAEESFDRYDPLVAVFTSLDTDGTVRLFGRLEPLLQQAYVELGYPNRDFRDTLERALRVIVETPRPPARMEVELAVKSFEFVDPALEGLSPVEKQLLRLGPDNLERVQAKAAELLAALGRG